MIASKLSPPGTWPSGTAAAIASHTRWQASESGCSQITCYKDTNPVGGGSVSRQVDTVSQLRVEFLLQRVRVMHQRASNSMHRCMWVRQYAKRAQFGSEIQIETPSSSLLFPGRPSLVKSRWSSAGQQVSAQHQEGEALLDVALTFERPAAPTTKNCFALNPR